MAYELIRIEENKFEIRLDNETYSRYPDELNFWKEMTITTTPVGMRIQTHSDSAVHILKRVVESLNTLYWHRQEVNNGNYTRKTPKPG